MLGSGNLPSSVGLAGMAAECWNILQLNLAVNVLGDTFCPRVVPEDTGRVVFSNVQWSGDTQGDVFVRSLFEKSTKIGKKMSKNRVLSTVGCPNRVCLVGFDTWGVKHGLSGAEDDTGGVFGESRICS